MGVGREIVQPFPTCVGMNRLSTTVNLRNWSVPHMRGDEPQVSHYLATCGAPFPTCVGMNRLCGSRSLMLPTVPHMRGDEPTSPVEVIAHWIPFPTCVGMNRRVTCT